MENNVNRDTRRTLNLDAKTDKLLQRLAAGCDGNLSMAARQAIRAEAERRGLVAPSADLGHTYAAPGR